MDAKVNLNIEVNGHHVIAHIVVENRSKDKPLYVEKGKGFAAASLRAKLFTITCDGSEVPYIGAMAKVEPSKPGDFITIEPGNHLRGTADVTSLYAFLPGSHEYEIAYSAFHLDPVDRKKILRLESSPVKFVFGR